MAKKTLIISSIFLVIIFIIFLIFSTSGFNEVGDIPNMCYTTLQPSQYFVGINPSPITYNSITNKLTISGDNLHSLSVGQAAATGSMRPLIGDATILIFIENITREDIKIGDIVSIKLDKNKNLLHRVVKITIIDGKTYYRVKGDNNPMPDKEQWEFKDIRAKVVGILY